MNIDLNEERFHSVISAARIQKRVREMARQISNDYPGKTIYVIALLENSFIFMADLVRALAVPVVCTFVKPRYRNQSGAGGAEMLEIVFSHELDVRDKDILLVEGLVHTGVTSEFLINDLQVRGAASIKLAALLDRQGARRVPLQPDYVGFLVNASFLVGYGLGGSDQTHRNLPYVAATSQSVPIT